MKNEEIVFSFLQNFHIFFFTRVRSCACLQRTRLHLFIRSRVVASMLGKIRMCESQKMKKNPALRVPPGGNQVDGLPPAPSGLKILVMIR